jgi:hypothetical protein
MHSNLIALMIMSEFCRPCALHVKVTPETSLQHNQLIQVGHLPDIPGSVWRPSQASFNVPAEIYFTSTSIEDYHHQSYLMLAYITKALKNLSSNFTLFSQKV